MLNTDTDSGISENEAELENLELLAPGLIQVQILKLRKIVRFKLRSQDSILVCIFMMPASKFSLFRDHNYNSELLNHMKSIFEFLKKIEGIFMVLFCHKRSN